MEQAKSSFTLKNLIKSELGRRLVEAPPKSLAKLHPTIREKIASQFGYYKEDKK